MSLRYSMRAWASQAPRVRRLIRADNGSLSGLKPTTDNSTTSW